MEGESAKDVSGARQERATEASLGTGEGENVPGDGVANPEGDAALAGGGDSIGERQSPIGRATGYIDSGSATVHFYTNRQQRLQSGARAAKGAVSPGIYGRIAELSGNQDRGEVLPKFEAEEVAPATITTN